MSLFERMVGAVSFAFTQKKGPIAPAFYTPYSDPGTNFIYNLLFCDDLQAFIPKGGHPASQAIATIFAEPPDTAALLTLAMDPAAEGRKRFLAFSRLLRLNLPVPPKILLGVIVETPVDGGLETLAAFSEGGARYINFSGKLLVAEGRIEGIGSKVDDLFRVAALVVAQIGPWGKDKARLPPPRDGEVRLSFLVSDGLYFGQGPYNVMAQGAMGGPIIQSANVLLKALLALPANQKEGP